MKKLMYLFLGIMSLLMAAFLFYFVFIVKAGPINSNKDNSVEVHGVVDQLYEGGVKDLVFKLKNDSNTYYINRALQYGFDLDSTSNYLLGKEITLWYAKHRSGPGGHMMQLQYKDSILYTEWEIPLAPKY